MKAANQAAVFGRRKEPHTVIIARGNEIRHFTIRPWVAAAAGSALAAIAIGYLTATSYLVLRDDLIGAATARQARMQHAYEDRISALRAQVDRITSRQLLDQQLMETKVSELLERQSQLSQRNVRLGPVLDKAAASEVTDAAPAGKTDERADITPTIDQPLAYAAADTAAVRPFSFWSTRTAEPDGESRADRADKLFVAINKSLRSIEDDQAKRIGALADNAYQTAGAITDALENAGLPVSTEKSGELGKTGVGGPLVPLDNPMAFDSPIAFESKVKELDAALDMLDRLKTEARKLPLANPAAGRSISSTFGVRTDPLIGTPALHSGMDFRAPYGSPARATAAGIVTKAGWNGGYGRMVEIDHGGGFTTRYAHLSKILVAPDQEIAVGDEIGEVGSSGRSTGPHLHYEVRRDGEAVDPLRFIKTGKKLGQYL
ncbi:M23 family metallopeptidase [Aminobacter ciceronei]|uniref:Murein DD-endopeptidase MepM/ murein hydrolase activator NlpD n=1 Tax=Aminobacter ciceronei TaxID=150723 RepID=A0ABR6C3T7_9HYPH|nr:M23 family metallopeptidase [Aminobacter ciceronei]MBA8905873.1 murein DD-endopeptidase MepM/ murein hydrolase activator NlpD [Aminobacter ciceronei]MBA9019652.1 murein DD-endopeptidase MepM/ murein hydrolase activator NlpD [Aminobacter ciceronei]